MPIRFPGLLAGVVMLLAAAATAASASTLDQIRARGAIHCGVTPALPGFASMDDDGNWAGFDVDLCRAVAAAVFGDPGKVEYISLAPEERFHALLSGRVDVLPRDTRWTMRHDTFPGVRFAAVAYHDGQGFMVRRKFGISSALELSGAMVCVQSGTTAQQNAADYFRRKNMPFEPVLQETAEETRRAYEAGRCDTLTADVSRLYAVRRRLNDSGQHMILPEIVSKEPMGPLVREGDSQWFDIVRWTVFAMINAEELGVNSANVDELKGSQTPAIRRLLGEEGDFGKRLGLDPEWAYRVIARVGNYAEVFERNLGGGSPLNIARGINALWNDGGILFAPPIR